MDTNQNDIIDAGVRAAFAAQGFMQLVGAEVDSVEKGRVVLSVARRPELLQQHGYFHGGVFAFLVDNATTAAAGTMISREDQAVLTAEYKLNFLSPGQGDRLVCEAVVLKPGRSLTVVEARVYAESEAGRRLCAAALASISVVELARVKP